MANDSITHTINGELRAGDIVVSHNANEYSYLAGIVRSITKQGEPDHDTGNAGDDVHVDFSALEYSPRRVSEIEGEFRKVSGTRREIDDLPLNDVIMNPATLIRANNIDLISRDEMYEILDSDEGAMEYCQRILTAHGLSLDVPTEEAIINKSFTIEKLYSPLEFYLHNPREEEANGEYGEYDLHDARYKISHFEVVEQYADAIELAIRRDRDTLDRVRGMAEYLPEELHSKVHSIFPNVEQRGFDMYCTATIQLIAPLTADETSALKDWWSGQLSDGWGEGFEQREIKVGYSGNELYMVPWTSDNNVFFLETGAEFAQRINVSPEYLGVTAQAAAVEQEVSLQSGGIGETKGEQGQSELLTAKLYSPIVCDKWETDYDDAYNKHEISQSEAAWHIDEIQAAIRKERLPEESARGLMTYFHDGGPVDEKVHSLFVDVEVHGKSLWAVSTVELTKPLDADELDTLRDYITGQFSDGFGEGFEQREVKIEDGELNVHLWNGDGEFFIDTQEQFAQRIGIELPADILSQAKPIFPPEVSAFVAEMIAPLLLDAKLYSPVLCTLWEDSDTYHDAPVNLSQEAMASEYKKIRAAVIGNRVPDEAERGLMAHYCPDSEISPDDVDSKVKSLFVDVEVHDGKLWAVASLKIAKPLTPEDLSTLRDYIEGQYSDGWGDVLSQQFIKIDSGEINVHLWKFADFFLDTQDKFAQRLGIELPADALSIPHDAALGSDMPNSVNKEPITPLEQLKERLNANFADYLETIKTLEGTALTQISSRISDMAEAHNYLTGDYAFKDTEIEYLLQFKNPLEIVADEFESYGHPVHFRETEMWRIFDRQEHDGYELVSEPTEPSATEAPKGYVIAVTEDSDSYISGALHIERNDGLHVYTNDEEAAKAAERDGVKLIYGMPFVPDGIYIDTPENREAIAHNFEQHRLSLPAEADVISALHDRFDENFAAYKAEALRLGKEGLFYDAPEITSVLQSHEYFRNEYAFTTGQAEFLLKFQNPLELVSDRWGDGIGGVRDVVNAIFSDQERTLNSGSYEIASDDPETPPTTISTQEKSNNVIGADGKSSVIDEIRQSQKDARERPSTPKDKSLHDKTARKNSEPNL